MILKIELENQKFLNIDFDNIIYLTGPNQKQLWQVFRSFYYYFNKNPKLTANIYGENKIEISLDDDELSVKNNDVYFINNRDSIYQQMIYKKDSMLFDLLNTWQDNAEINQSLERINDEIIKLELKLQSLVDEYSDNLKTEFQETTYMDLLKGNLLMNYQVDDKNYPLEFMDTETLLDEFLNLLEFKLTNNKKTSWLVLYNLDSFISASDDNDFVDHLKLLLDKYDLKIIYIGNDLNEVPIDATDFEKIVISAQGFSQLLPYDELIKSVKMHYPNEYEASEKAFVSSVKRVAPLVGNINKMFISNKDLVLLKVVNDILGYETSYDLNSQLLSNAETKFLED